MSLTDLSYLEEKFIFHLCKHCLLSNRFHLCKLSGETQTAAKVRGGKVFIFFTGFWLHFTEVAVSAMQNERS